jgi:hypothetical protein
MPGCKLYDDAERVLYSLRYLDGSTDCRPRA